MSLMTNKFVLQVQNIYIYIYIFFFGVILATDLGTILHSILIPTAAEFFMHANSLIDAGQRFQLLPVISLCFLRGKYVTYKGGN